jgi:photosystem II stability/assembly factor-like uncharacterized protein
MRRLYVGTEKGLEILTERDDGWHLDRTLLQDFEISAVVKSAEGVRLWVATRQAGLFTVQPESGAVESVGADVLPKGLRCIAVSATDPDLMFVGGEPATMFRSCDGGKTWRECLAVAEIARERNWKYHVPQIPPHIRQILIDRNDPQRVYAAVQIGGLLRSEDGGETWQDVVDSLDPDVHAIAQDRENADVLFASTGAGGPIGGPHPPVAPFGFPLYRSNDAGKTWASISSDFERRHSVPIHLYPKDSGTIVAAVAADTPGQWRRPEGANAVLMVSPDRGETWRQVSDGLPASFRVMIEAIETEARPDGRTYIGIGGEGTKMLPPEQHKGAVYYADRLDGPWMRLPKDFPVVFTVTAA